MTFTGWPPEAVGFFVGLAADNSRSYWQAHRDVYERAVRGPMSELLAGLPEEYGSGHVFRPNRDVRFSADKSPYKLSCDAHVRGGYLSFSAGGLLAGSGLFLPPPAALARFRAAVADDTAGPALEAIVADLVTAGYDISSSDAVKTAPRGYPPDHPRIELLRRKGVVMSATWPPEELGTPDVLARVVTCFAAARPLRDWLDVHVG